MEKILVLGDIHGRTCWADIIEKENPDKVIFLGDYVSTHENISSDQQCSNLEDILNYKEANPDKIIYWIISFRAFISSFVFFISYFESICSIILFILIPPHIVS